MRKPPGKAVDLMVLLVFLLFALCLLGVLLTGAGIYQRLVERSETRFTQQTTASYIATRVRQAKTVAVEDFQGCNALVLRETSGGEDYVTRVYLYEGYLRELYSTEDAKLYPEDGETLLPETTLELALDQGLLTVCTGSQTRLLRIRTGQEVLP